MKELRACSLRTHKEYLFKLERKRGCCGIFSIDDYNCQWMIACTECPLEEQVNKYLSSWIDLGKYRGVYYDKKR